MAAQGVPHRFRIHGTKPARILALGGDGRLVGTVPGGIDELYDFVGTPATERRIPDDYPPEAEIGRWVEAGPRRGMQVLGPPLPE